MGDGHRGCLRASGGQAPLAPHSKAENTPPTGQGLPGSCLNRATGATGGASGRGWALPGSRFRVISTLDLLPCTLGGNH